MRLRASPCRARSRGRSLPRSTRTWPSSTRAVIPAGSGTLSLPFGPSTDTVPPAMETVTPLVIGTGFLPIRDIVPFPFRVLPDGAENLASDPEPLALAPGQDPLRG